MIDYLPLRLAMIHSAYWPHAIIIVYKDLLKMGRRHLILKTWLKQCINLWWCNRTIIILGQAILVIWYGGKIRYSLWYIDAFQESCVNKNQFTLTNGTMLRPLIPFKQFSDHANTPSGFVYKSFAWHTVHSLLKADLSYMFIFFRWFSLPSYFQSPVMGKTANSETRLIADKTWAPNLWFGS